MADPTRYTPGFNYSGWEADHPTEPKPGAELDNDFAHIRHSIDETIRALRDVRRSDGKVQNATVDFDALSPAVKAALSGSEFDYEVIEDLLAKAENLADVDDAAAAVANLGLQDAIVLPTAADLQSATIPDTAKSLRLAGLYIAGDGLGGAYERGDQGPGAIQSNDGQWWRPTLLAGSSGILNESDLAGLSVSDALNNTPGRTLLGEIVLDEPYQGIIHFSDIPPDFTHLVLDFSARLDDPSPAADVLRLRTNSTDTATNSFGGNVFLTASSGGLAGGIGSGVSNLHICDLPDGSAADGVYGSGSVTFYNYATLMHGPYFSRAGTHNKEMRIRMGVNTAADEIIHSLLVWAGNNSIVTGREWLAAGSRFQLWGVRGNPPVAALWVGL